MGGIAGIAQLIEH